MGPCIYISMEMEIYLLCISNKRIYSLLHLCVYTIMLLQVHSTY